MEAYISKPTFDGWHHVYEVPFETGIRKVEIIEQPYFDTFTSKSGTKYFDIKLPVTDDSFEYWQNDQNEDDAPSWYCEASIKINDAERVLEEYNVGDDIRIHIYKDFSGRKRASVKLD